MDISGSTPPEREPVAAEREIDAAEHDPARPEAALADRAHNDPAEHDADPDGATQQDAAQQNADRVEDAVPANPQRSAGALFGVLAVYTLLRLALVAVLTAALSFFMPLIVALMFAIVVQLPLAWVLFGRQRNRVNEAIAQASSRRRAERSRLQAGLSGDLGDLR